MADFLIREATDEDGPALGRLMESAWAEHDGAGGDAPPRPEVERPASHFAERGGRLWVVTRDGEMAGSLGVLAAGLPMEFELSAICIDKESRGEGFAAALLAGANAFAAASGGERLSVWADVRLEDVHRFCERHGFVREPGVRAGHEGSDALLCRFSRPVS